MFDLDPGKLIVIGIVALIAIPSKDLPRVLRALGQMVGKMRRMSTEFQGQFMEAMREMDVADLKKEMEETNRAVMDATSGAFDPMTQARKQITSAVEGETTTGGASIPEPHPEEALEAPSRRMGRGANAVSEASFETPASRAPQDEAAGFPQDEIADASKKASP